MGVKSNTNSFLEITSDFSKCHSIPDKSATGVRCWFNFGSLLFKCIRNYFFFLEFFLLSAYFFLLRRQYFGYNLWFLGYWSIVPGWWVSGFNILSFRKCPRWSYSCWAQWGEATANCMLFVFLFYSFKLTELYFILMFYFRFFGCSLCPGPTIMFVIFLTSN